MPDNGRTARTVAPGVDLRMTSDRPGRTESGRLIPAGTTVEYRGHASGLAVRVELEDGTTDVMNPLCFPNLR